MSSQLEKTATVSSSAARAAYSDPNSTVITTTTSHGFKIGDQVIYKTGTGTASGIMGLTDGKAYTVAAPLADNSFGLKEVDGTTGMTYGALAGYTGEGDTFSLASLAGQPTVGEAGAAAPSSETNITESLKIYGYVGTQTITYPTGSSSRSIAEAVTAKSGVTGVSAYAETNARITVSPNNTSDADGNTIISFKLQGMNATPVTVSSTIKFGTGENGTSGPTYQADLSDLRDKINGYSGDTGISATLSYDRTYIDITSPDGYDIVVDDFDMSANTTTAHTSFIITHDESTADDGTMGSAKSTSFTTTSGVSTFFKASHGLQVGDMVRITDLSAGQTLTSATGKSTVSQNKLYFVKAVTANSFVLATDSATGTALNMANSNDDDLDFTFTKMEKTLNIQALDRDGNIKGTKIKLHDQDLGSNEDTAPGPGDVASSMRLSGQIVYESPNVFTIDTSAAANTGKKLFRDAPPSASLLRISDIDVLTVTNSQRMLSAVDGALRRIDAERGDLGATMNRMEHTIDNLSNIVMNTKVAKGRKADADMAAESIELSKSRILQQAATSMLAQANKSMQSVLELLQ